MQKTDPVLKSEKLKIFIDLRMSYECILKSVVSRFTLEGKTKRSGLREIEALGHNIGKLEATAYPYLPRIDLIDSPRFAEKLDKLPVGLRYSQDCYDFIYTQYELYEEAIVRPKFMTDLRGHTEAIFDGITSTTKRIRAVDLKSPPDPYNKYERS